MDRSQSSDRVRDSSEALMDRHQPIFSRRNDSGAIEQLSRALVPNYIFFHLKCSYIAIFGLISWISCAATCHEGRNYEITVDERLSEILWDTNFTVNAPRKKKLNIHLIENLLHFDEFDSDSGFANPAFLSFQAILLISQQKLWNISDPRGNNSGSEAKHME